jgi:hypothetical protein
MIPQFDLLDTPVEETRSFERAVMPRTRPQASPASHEAAQRATPKASHWARLALQLYAGGLELTPDEVSDRINWAHERSIKPRVSGMLKRGFLELTGERRPFDNGVARRGPGDVLRVTALGLKQAG